MNIFSLRPTESLRAVSPRTYWLVESLPFLFLIFWCVALYSVTVARLGEYVYALDDAYIHTAVAKNLVLHHTWGINPNIFSGASSSPLWTVILAISMKIFGLYAVIPFLLNCLCAVWLVSTARQFCRELTNGRIAWQHESLILFLIIAMGTLVGLVASGMEHILQSTMCLVWLLALYRVIPKEVVTMRELVWIGILMGLCVVARYESLAMAFVATGYCVFTKRYRLALALFLGCCLAVGSYALYSLSHGGDFLPNSVLIKSATYKPGIAGYLSLVWLNIKVALKFCPEIAFMLILASIFVLPNVVSMIKKEQYNSPFTAIGLIVIGSGILHIPFAKTGPHWFNRYEAYLIILLLIFVGSCLSVSLSELVKSIQKTVTPLVRRITENTLDWCIRVLTFAALVGLCVRGYNIHSIVVNASGNIHEQQWTMSAILKESVDSSDSSRAWCAVNDIGVVAWASGLLTMDVVGLGDNDVYYARRKHRSTAVLLDSIMIVRNVKAIAIYDYWWKDVSKGGCIFSPVTQLQDIPSRWIRSGELNLTHKNVICGGPTVSFYATDSTTYRRLQASIARHTPNK